VLVVDDSPSARALLSARLRSQGHEVAEAPDAETAAEIAFAGPPEVVVTDLLMPGLSGVQLCRLLRSDPSTAHVPVVLLTASGDKRSRFWARSAGAAAYVGKDRIDELVGIVPSLVAAGRPPPRTAARARSSGKLTLQRISEALDRELFDSVLAGEVRALASAADLKRLFEAVAALLGEVLSYRWLALLPNRVGAPLFLHASPAARAEAEGEARQALAAPAHAEVTALEDDRASGSPGTPPHVTSVSFGGQPVGRLAVAAAGRGLSHEDQRMLALVAAELGGPIQMTVLYEDARLLATTDVLTGLLNRRAILDAMQRECARADRHAFPIALLLLDVDHFKQINDLHGHAAGDAVLQSVARVLAAAARRSDFVARWGGEEFVVALPQTGDAGARIAAERLRRAIAESRVEVGAREPVRVTVSIGLASATAPWSIDALVSAADEAMYAAKARGRNRVEVFARP
jgi:two-component system cell cycle response regulator